MRGEPTALRNEAFTETACAAKSGWMGIFTGISRKYRFQDAQLKFEFRSIAPGLANRQNPMSSTRVSVCPGEARKGLFSAGGVSDSEDTKYFRPFDSSYSIIYQSLTNDMMGGRRFDAFTLPRNWKPVTRSPESTPTIPSHKRGTECGPFGVRTHHPFHRRQSN
jgi:hypothetical protein